MSNNKRHPHQETTDVDYTPQPGLTVEARLLVLEEMLGRIEQRLFGNGQPGVLTTMDARITALEQMSWKLVGGISVGLLAWEFVKPLLTHK